MTAEILIPNTIAAKLIWLSKTLDSAQQEIAQADDVFVRAKQRHEVTYARAFLDSEGAVDVRKQLAVTASATERFDMDLAEARVRSCRERLRVLFAQVEITRSLSVSVRAAMDVA